MSGTANAIAAHYTSRDLGQKVLAALAEAGVDIDALKPSDLSAIDQFHNRGMAVTKEQAALANLGPGDHVLDIGCAVGGPARYMAEAHGCRVTGIDVTEAYIEAAELLTARCGMGEGLVFRTADALALPFPDETFDVVWTQNVTMNIEDERRFYDEAFRVLKSGGRFTSTDMAAGPSGDPYYPLPWAMDPEISFLSSPDEMRSAAEAAGFEIVDWRDTSEAVLATAAAPEQKARGGKLGVGLIAGENFAQRQANNAKSLKDGKLVNLTTLARRP